jgi:hypothetical protein
VGGSHLISASRRTDIPRFYARWFAERRRAGRAEFRNSFGIPGSVSLKNEDVLGYLFWTRYAAPLREQLRALQGEGIPYAFQFTLTGYGAPVEPFLPPLRSCLADFLRTSRELPGPRAIEWRYDPILLNERFDRAFHLGNFGRLARALAGATLVVNTSVVEPYARATRRLQDPSLRFRPPRPGRHATVLRRNPGMLVSGGETAELLAEMADIARGFGLELRSCSNPEWALPPSQCCSPDLFMPYGDDLVRRLAALRQAPSRLGCRCLEMVDIGMDDSCPAGCRYCYAVNSQDAALSSFRLHDPKAPRLR